MFFAEMTSAATVGWFAIVLLIGLPAIILLSLWTASRWPGYDSQLVYESGSLGAPGAFREPADPSYVDELIRVRGRASVVHRPDPFELAGVDLPVIEHPYKMTLTELVEGARYVIPTTQAAGHVPHHASGVVDTSRRASAEIGRHRAPILVAA